MRVGDVDAKEIFTKTDYLYDCNITTEKQGPCEVWESREEDYNTSYRTDVVFKSEDFSGSSAELFNLVAAFNGVQYIWGGWKGICTDGTITDFSWAEDPLYWASLALQVFGDDIGGSVGLTEDTLQYAQCAAQAAIGAGGALMDYYDDSEIPCDPVDEFCGGTDESSPDNILSVDEQSWNDALAQNPDLANYTEILSAEDGILIVKFSPQSTEGMTGVEAAAENEKAKEMQLVFQSVLVGVNAAVCVGSVALGGNSTSTASSGSATSAGNIVSSVVNWFVPDPILGAALNVVIQLAASFQDIDTCNDKEDAQERGSRHLKTFTHKQYDMCHMYWKQADIQSTSFTDYDNYHFCCYPDAVSRILVVQIKAQLARGWAHCTDITFKDLERVNFQSCSVSQVSDPGTVDGAIIKFDATLAEREKAYQFKHKCINYSELEEHLSNSIGSSIDNHFIEEQFEGLQGNNFEVEEEE
jgi:hypothetical protein